MKRILFILMIVLFTLPLRAGAEEFKSSANIFEELESAQAGSTTMHQLTQKPKTINFVTFPGIFGKQYSEILYFDLKWARNATKKML